MVDIYHASYEVMVRKHFVFREIVSITKWSVWEGITAFFWND